MNNPQPYLRLLTLGRVETRFTLLSLNRSLV